MGALKLHSLGVKDWKDFYIEKLFDAFIGEDLIISETEEGNIPVASNSCENNNIAFFAAPILNRKLFDSKLSISIADRGKFWAFVQPLDFYIGTRVKALVSNKVYLNTHKNKKTDFISEVSLSFCLNLMVFFTH